MKKLVAFLALPLLFSTGLAHAEDPSRFRAPPIMKQALANHVQPAYAAFEQSASNLEKTTTVLCAEASSEGLSKARQDFAGVVDAWSRIEWLRTGPVMAENRLERILFYPDRKGTGLKQVQRAIAGKDNAVTDVSLLAGGSVAVQGSVQSNIFFSGAEAKFWQKTHRPIVAAMPGPLQAICMRFPHRSARHGVTAHRSRLHLQNLHRTIRFSATAGRPST